ncbi:hypothetical protein V2J09_007015 [Rumex salicifolius]
MQLFPSQSLYLNPPKSNTSNPPPISLHHRTTATTTMSIKDCGHHDHKKKLRKRILIGILIFLVLILLTVLIIWAALKPDKPRFILQDATVYAFNLSSPNLLTSTFQVTVQSRNPNSHIGVYYERLVDTEGKNIWSPFVMGVSVPIAPFTGEALNQDQTTGRLLMNFKMDGRVRWKVGTYVSGNYHLHVDCPAVIAVGNPNAGIVVGRDAVKYQLIQSCTVSV